MEKKKYVVWAIFMLNDPYQKLCCLVYWYTINADHVTSVYFTDWFVNCKKLAIFNAVGHSCSL